MTIVQIDLGGSRFAMIVVAMVALFLWGGCCILWVNNLCGILGFVTVVIACL